MDRVKIKEHIIRTLKQSVGDVPYAITGDYPEHIKTIHVAVSIIGETPVMGEMSSLIGINEYTDQETRMYVYTVVIGITIYGPIDEETATIANQIRTAILEHKYNFLNHTIGITRIMGLGGLSAPALAESGGRKTWATRLSLNIQVTEIIQTEPM